MGRTDEDRAEKRRYVLEEAEDMWVLSTPSTGEIRQSGEVRHLLTCLFSDMSEKPGELALAEWLVELVAGLHKDACQLEEYGGER